MQPPNPHERSPFTNEEVDRMLDRAERAEKQRDEAVRALKRLLHPPLTFSVIHEMPQMMHLLVRACDRDYADGLVKQLDPGDRITITD